MSAKGQNNDFTRVLQIYVIDQVPAATSHLVPVFGSQRHCEKSCAGEVCSHYHNSAPSPSEPDSPNHLGNATLDDEYYVVVDEDAQAVGNSEATLSQTRQKTHAI